MWDLGVGRAGEGNGGKMGITNETKVKKERKCLLDV